MANKSWKTALAGLLAIIGVAIIFIGFAAYFWKFHDDLSIETSDWGNFGSYAAGIGALALGCASIAALLFASVIVPEEIERFRREEQRARAASDMSKLFYSRDYYVNIIVPVWDIATKWLSWEGSEGERYRRDVAGGQFLFAQAPFQDEQGANSVPFQNHISLRSHFEPIANQSSPNEHMILSMWLTFWHDLQAAIANGVISEQEAVAKFSGFYAWTHDFIQQLWMVGECLGAMKMVKAPAEKAALWKSLGSLERCFYGEDYRREKNETRAEEIARAIASSC
ncbi:MAG: hypothetical protein QM740_19740 [Acidovorax sp.]